MEKYKNISYYLVIGLIFILGIFLRTSLYISNNVFEDDECRLVISMLDKNLWQMFLPLGFAQSAPPVFLLFSKLAGELSGYAEAAMKFIPFVSGIAAFALFFLFCKEYFSQKLSLVICLFLFAINQNYIAYSSVFKQYSADILFCILCLFFFPKINIAMLNTKKLSILSLILILLPLCSLPSALFIAAFIILNLIDNFKNKEFYKKLIFILIPFVFCMVLYYIFNLVPSKVNMDEIYLNYWDNGFWKLSLVDFIRILAFNLKFDFAPNNLALFEIILVIWGSFICAIDWSEKRKISLFILFSIIIAFFTSLLHIYPLAGRVGLFLSPLFILTSILPIDKSEFRKLTYWTAIVFIIFAFCGYSVNYLSKCNDSSYVFRHSPASLMLELKDKFNQGEDVVLCNAASSASYVFYSSKYQFNTPDVYEMDIKLSDESSVNEYLNGLSKNQKYWLYLIKDYRRKPIFPYIHKWLENKKVLYLKKEKDSYLIYFEK